MHSGKCCSVAFIWIVKTSDLPYRLNVYSKLSGNSKVTINSITGKYFSVAFLWMVTLTEKIFSQILSSVPTRSTTIKKYHMLSCFHLNHGLQNENSPKDAKLWITVRTTLIDRTIPEREVLALTVGFQKQVSLSSTGIYQRCMTSINVQ